MAYNLNIRGRLYSLTQPRVMGILNLTPDSFFEGSRVTGTDAALRRVEEMIAQGVDMVDVGAISSRPGSALADEQEERRRLEEPLKAICRKFPQLIVSVDTYRSSIARLAADCGAHIINDISGGIYDDLMFKTVGELQLPYIMMHLRGTPMNMQDNPTYEDVVRDLIRYFSEKLDMARQNGIHDVIIDPGFGFAKTMEHNYTLLARLKEFEILDRPVLVGISRKSMLYRLLGTSPEEALNATTAAHMIALGNGASILRVHDVREARECVRIYMAASNK